MGQVFLGKMSLRWCDHCDLPILEKKECQLCSGPTRKVDYTPPGDVRPAFERDVRQIRNIIAEQFGKDASESIFAEDSLVLLNGVPSLDRMDEVVVHGRAIGNLKYLPIAEKYVFIPRQFGLQLFQGHIESNFIVADDGAIPFIKKGANCLAPGVLDAVGDFRVGDEVIVIDKTGNILMSGKARMGPGEMIEAKRGEAVKARRRLKDKTVALTEPEIKPTWDRAVQANKDYLKGRIAGSKKFINKVIKANNLPFTVSYSGGKDSLATLLLVLDADLKPPIMFVDTGLEFPETVENVHQVVKRYGLELIEYKVGDSFYDSLEHFGPPAKDFRWCCKICKLGPTTMLIDDRFPEGVLSFIGQRQYESTQRMEKGDIWDNPWVPNQKGASPIQRWDALTVWLYIFYKKATYNPWYERGLDRIGCWCCPASSQAELKEIKEHFPQSSRFFGMLKDWAEKKKFSQEWYELGLWKWRKYPGSVQEIMQRSGFNAERIFGDDDPEERWKAALVDFKDVEWKFIGQGPNGIDEMEMIEVKADFTRNVDISSVVPLLPILGEISFKPSEICKSGTNIGDSAGDDPGNAVIMTPKGDIITLHSRGVELITPGDDEIVVLPRRVHHELDNIIGVIKRALFCQACGVCTGRCPQDAIAWRDLRGRRMIVIDPERCISCRNCLGPCPVVNFDPDEEYRMAK